MARKRSTSARGYGSPHQQIRKRLAPVVATGAVKCATCGEPIDPRKGWHLGHTEDRSSYTGPEHVGCNLRKAALKTNQVRVRRTSREW